MIANLVDVDESMILAACESDEGGAVLFDFAAAFPSVEHRFLHRVFERIGWPKWLLNFIGVMYCNNSCEIVLGGAAAGRLQHHQRH